MCDKKDLKRYIVLVKCRDLKGLVHKITGVLLDYNLNIEKQDEFIQKDKENPRFFMRSDVFGERLDVNSLSSSLMKILPENAKLKVEKKEKKNIAIMATMEPHCLGDLLIRNAYGELNADIKLVISNHKKLEELVNKFSLPFYYISHKGLKKREHEAKILNLLSSFNLDYIILAKYMRILSSEFVNLYKNKIINIHHSFLPAFIGANPYLQAFTRGVKIVGATAHFVTSSLDEGPIIAQDVVGVSHSEGVRDMIRKGRDVEKIVLARALRLVFDNKVFISENRTVVFD